MRLDAARVQPLQEEVDRLRLARSADAGDDHHDGDVRRGKLALRLQEGRAD